MFTIDLKLNVAPLISDPTQMLGCYLSKLRYLVMTTTGVNSDMHSGLI
jgi:hypothetical protein